MMEKGAYCGILSIFYVMMKKHATIGELCWMFPYLNILFAINIIDVSVYTKH